MTAALDRLRPATQTHDLISRATAAADSAAMSAADSAPRVTPRRIVCAAGAILTALSGAAALGALPVTARHFLASIGRDLTGLRWPFLALVVALSAAHYVASALAARAAAGLRTPVWETILVQLAASTANRLTPLGAGGAMLNARYFSRRGRAPIAAAGAVAALTVIGAMADFLGLLAIVTVGPWLGLRGSGSAFALLGHHLPRLGAPTLQIACPVLAGLGLVIGLTPVARRVLARGRRLFEPITSLLQQPTRLLTLILSSAGTTIALGIAFVLSAPMVAGVQPTTPAGALLIEFMLAGAGAALIPAPASIGPTELALIAVLTAGGLPAAHATTIVLTFRVLTFWLPALVGIPATLHLRKRHAL